MNSLSTIEVQLEELTGTQGGQATVNPAPPARRAESSAVASVAWIPFKTYDALFLFLLAVNALCHASGITYGASPTPAGWNIVLILLYLLLLAARNAQLNRGIFSAKSFFSYVTTISLVIPFALLPDKINGAKEANAALAVTLLVAAFIVGLAANIAQVILRPIFQRFLFRKRIAGLPANAL